MATETREIDVLDPIAHPTPIPTQLAERLSTLEGTTIGLLENTKFNSDKLLAYLGEVLQRDFGVKQVLYMSKRSASFPAPEEVYDELARRTDAVVTGVGD